MKTENVPPLDLHAEYYRTLDASRIAGTALLLLCAAWSGMHCYGIPEVAEVFENMVTGGLTAMPRLTQLVINHSTEAVALSCLPALVAVLYIWVAGRNLSRVILTTSLGAGFSLLMGLVVQLALNQPLRKIITDFNG